MCLETFHLSDEKETAASHGGTGARETGGGDGDGEEEEDPLSLAEKRSKILKIVRFKQKCHYYGLKYGRKEVRERYINSG